MLKYFIYLVDPASNHMLPLKIKPCMPLSISLRLKTPTIISLMLNFVIRMLCSYELRTSHYNIVEEHNAL